MIRAIVLLIAIAVISCRQTIPYKTINDRTMGTTYSVVYQSNIDYSQEIGELLLEINEEVSTYIPDSDISLFNKEERLYVIKDSSFHFRTNWMISNQIFRETNGYFDPTVMPLINYWGFGYTEKKAKTDIDSTAVDSLMDYVGLDKISLNGNTLTKIYPGIELDFSAIAKGYAVDAISNLLMDENVNNFLVEIGGEVYTSGVNKQGIKWRLGINTPKEEASQSDFELITKLNEKGMASSGNYRNFYLVDGKKYGHTIDPHTGYPSINELLGVTVIADNCITADGYATAFMSMGLEKANIMANKNTFLAVCFFTSDNQGNIQKTFKNGFVQYLPRK